MQFSCSCLINCVFFGRMTSVEGREAAGVMAVHCDMCDVHIAAGLISVDCCSVIILPIARFIGRSVTTFVTVTMHVNYQCISIR